MYLMQEIDVRMMTTLVKLMFNIVQWILIFKRILFQPISNNMQTFLTINFEFQTIKTIPVRGVSCYTSIHNVIIKIAYSLKIKKKAVGNLLKKLILEDVTKYRSCYIIHKGPTSDDSSKII
ncbi:hypothetical protein O3M35_003309 [Rhynocoris fuscipes]|uniref:Uncharacterized protein n=1 Tax=Rhynocoris fuscipes TaxID=488301 RepID=A0AAW1CK12_9HEMI